MNEITCERLFGFRHAFDAPVTIGLTIGTVALLLLAPLVISLVTRAGKPGRQRAR